MAHKGKMAEKNKICFMMMSLVHKTLYGVFRDPYQVLRSAGLDAGQQVLEIGCGPGFFTIPAAQIVGEEGRLVALDINPLAVAHVQREIQRKSITNATTLLAPAARTTLPDQEFDLAYVFGFVRPVGGMGAVWPELHRLVRAAGILSIEGRIQPPAGLFQLLTRKGRISRFTKSERVEYYENEKIPISIRTGTFTTLWPIPRC
jgi:ubiquinone/menaquinone biosynthesis C-methylase UbiE